MCTIRFLVELNTCKIDVFNICEKSEPVFKMDDASVRHPPVYVDFLDDSPVRHPPSKVLRWTNYFSRLIS